MKTSLKPQSKNHLTKLYDEASERAASYVRREYPHLVGVMVQGSVARRDVGPFSDIDLIGVTSHRKKPAQFSFFDGNIYIPVGFRSVAELEREFKDPKQFFWARGSAKTSTRILYDPKGVLRRIMFKGKHARPSHRILEETLWDEHHHIIEYSGKLRNGWDRNDEYLTRYAARIIAQHAENAVIALNDLSPISEGIVWHQVLRAKKRPKHLATDYPLSLGIRGTTDTSAVYRSAMRLCGETLRLIRDEFGKKAKHLRFKALLEEPLENHGL